MDYMGLVTTWSRKKLLSDVELEVSEAHATQLALELANHMGYQYTQLDGGRLFRCDKGFPR